MTAQRRRIVVRGRVQGVAFRATTQTEAQRRALVGWVRNRSDGAVELEAQGTVEHLDELVRWCHRGPALARVESVEVSPCAPVPGEAQFMIRR